MFLEFTFRKLLSHRAYILEPTILDKWCNSYFVGQENYPINSLDRFRVPIHWFTFTLTSMWHQKGVHSESSHVFLKNFDWRHIEVLSWPAVLTFKMEDSSKFTVADRKRMEIIEKQFARKQRKIAQLKRQNIAVFSCLLLSVAGICIL